ncbi:unnamed protein product, partial [Urochloa humidicola]
SRTAELTWSDWLAISSDPGGRLRPEIPTSSCRPHRLGYEAFLEVVDPDGRPILTQQVSRLQNNYFVAGHG